jgi:hypothetical protein
MPRGSSEIPELRLSVLQKLVTKFTMDPNLMLSSMFPSSISPSSNIKWESMEGSRGMTPFVPPGAPAPVTAPHGVARHSAEAAYWKEKMPFDEEFLNNLRKEGTDAEYLSAQQRLAREMAGLANRSNRRKEWMFAKMLANNGFDYKVKEGYQASISYQIPSTHRPTLGTSAYWDTGGSRDILGNIITGKRTVANDCGGQIDYAICNSNVLKMLASDTTIRDILKKSAFGPMANNLYEGNLHAIVGVNPRVVASLLDIQNFIVYDEMFEVRAWLTGAVTGNSTTWLAVDDASDIEAGDTVRLIDVSEGTYEDIVCYSVDQTSNVVQLNRPPTSSYRANEDFISVRKFFIPDDKFVMFASRVEGQMIAEYKQAPFGLSRHYGQLVDRHDKWDPEVTYIRVQDKGLPILYQRDAMYVITVTQRASDAVTTTSSSTTTTTA